MAVVKPDSNTIKCMDDLTAIVTSPHFPKLFFRIIFGNKLPIMLSLLLYHPFLKLMSNTLNFCSLGGVAMILCPR